MKNILIIGATSQIGKEISEKLAIQKYNLFLTGRNQENLVNLSQELKKINPKNQYFKQSSDLREEGALEELFSQASSKLGIIESVVYNAGLYFWSPIEREPESKTTEKDLLRINLEIPHLLCRLFVQKIKKHRRVRPAKIILIGSISGLVGEPNASLYSSTKAGLVGLTKSLALELAEDQISINLINPGWVKTDLLTKDLQANHFSEEEILETVPQKRWVEPSEIGELVSFLISDAANSITGQSINLCAGLSLG